jgi:hypothetical protein
MDPWIAKLNEIVNVVLGTPASPLEKWLLIVLGSLALIGSLGKVGASLGIPNTGVAYSVIVAVIGVGLSLAALAAAAVYLPAWEDPGLRRWIWIGVPVLVSLIVVIPLTCVLQKSNVLAALLTWALGLGAAVAVLLLVGAIFTAIQSRQGDIERGKARKQEVEELTR